MLYKTKFWSCVIINYYTSRTKQIYNSVTYISVGLLTLSHAVSITIYDANGHIQYNIINQDKTPICVQIVNTNSMHLKQFTVKLIKPEFAGKYYTLHSTAFM